MRILSAALILPILAACTPDAPVQVAAPAPAAVPVPPGCTVSAATRATLAAMTLDDAIDGAADLGLSASDVLRLWRLRDGIANPGDLNYAQGCLGVTVPA